MGTVIGYNGTVFSLTYNLASDGVIRDASRDSVHPVQDVLTGDMILGSIVPPSRGNDGGDATTYTVSVTPDATLNLNIEQKVDW